MVSLRRSFSSNSLYMRSGATSANSNRPSCMHWLKKVAAWLFAMSLGPCAPTMDKADVSSTQSRGSNGNHAMFAVASGTGCIPVERWSASWRGWSRAGGRLLLAHAQLHHLGRLTANDLLDAIGPPLQSDAN